MNIFNQDLIKIIFPIFPYDKNSGGNSIVPNMIKNINKLFKEPVIYVFILGENNYSEDENLPLATHQMIDDKNNISICSEAIGNPLNFYKIVRFNFYFNIYEPNVEDEYNVFFIKGFHKLYNHVRSLYGIRTIENIKFYDKYINYFYNLKYILDICKDNGLLRNGCCYTFRKSSFHPHIRDNCNYHSINSYEIHHNESNPFDLVSIFNKFKYFYSYDGFTFISCIASLCGCISIIVPFSGFNSIYEFNENEYFTNGIAYGDSEEQINHAINTKNRLRESLIELKNHNYDDDFKDLIFSIYKNFNCKPPELKLNN